MPEETETEDAAESGNGGQPRIAERAVQHKEVRIGVAERHQIETRLAAPPGLKHRNVVKQCQADIRDQPAGIEMAQVTLAAECLDRAIAGRRAHEIDSLQVIAER